MTSSAQTRTWCSASSTPPPRRWAGPPGPPRGAPAPAPAGAQVAGAPQVGLGAAIVAVPTIASDKTTALAVLTGTVELWTKSAGGVSPAIDRDLWEKGY